MLELSRRGVLAPEPAGGGASRALGDWPPAGRRADRRRSKPTSESPRRASTTAPPSGARRRLAPGRGPLCRALAARRSSRRRGDSASHPALFDASGHAGLTGVRLQDSEGGAGELRLPFAWKRDAAHRDWCLGACGCTRADRGGGTRRGTVVAFDRGWAAISVARVRVGGGLACSGLRARSLRPPLRANALGALSGSSEHYRPCRSRRGARVRARPPRTIRPARGGCLLMQRRPLAVRPCCRRGVLEDAAGALASSSSPRGRWRPARGATRPRRRAASAVWSAPLQSEYPGLFATIDSDGSEARGRRLPARSPYRARPSSPSARASFWFRG